MAEACPELHQQPVIANSNTMTVMTGNRTFVCKLRYWRDDVMIRAA